MPAKTTIIATKTRPIRPQFTPTALLKRTEMSGNERDFVKFTVILTAYPILLILKSRKS